MVKINELNTPKLKKTNNSKLYKNFLKLLMSAGLFITPLAGCASEEQPIKNSDTSQPSDPVVEKSQIELLAQEYDHLQWYLDNPYSKIVDGVTYDIQALKEEYGDLYRFVEPLSKEDVEYRFQYLAEFFVVQVQDGSFERYNGGISDVSDKVRDEIYKKRNSNYEKMGTTNDEKLKKYSNHYIYVEKIGRYSIVRGGTFSNLMTQESMIDIIDQFTFEEKDWFVREYMTETDMVLNLLQKNNENPRFNFKAEQRTK